MACRGGLETVVNKLLCFKFIYFISFSVLVRLLPLFFLSDWFLNSKLRVVVSFFFYIFVFRVIRVLNSLCSKRSLLKAWCYRSWSGERTGSFGKAVVSTQGSR